MDECFTLEATTFEICCGAAGLSDALRRLGFQVYPIDHAANRHAPKVKVFTLDVSNLQHVALLEKMMRHCKPCHIHMGLPCGTCSRAREKPMPAKFGGHMGPPPLRDAENLLGLPGLSTNDQTKVELANKLYQCAIQLLKVCKELGCMISIENPARSWLWALLAMLVKATNDDDFIAWFANLESVYFDACAHGSTRDKRTKLLSTPGLFTSLEANCLQNHIHSSWQPYRTDQGIVFPTAAEAEYPALLCRRMAACVLQMAQSMNIKPEVPAKLKDLLKSNMGQQTLSHPPLVPEYKTYVYTDVPETKENYKLLAAPHPTGVESTEQQPDIGETPSKRSRTTYKYGVWHTPEEFLQKASEVRHPMDHDLRLHSITKDAIQKVVHTCPTKLAKERLAAVFRVRKMATELCKDEAALKSSMHPDVSRCVNTKSILLFEQLLQHFGFWDMEVVNLLKHGVPLVGLQPSPEGYQKLLVPACMTEDELPQTARWRRQSIMQGARQLTTTEEKALMEATDNEVERGFLQGPYSEAEMSVLMESEDWSLNPRFVLFQGANNKVRVIDDAKQGSVNAAYSSTVKLQLQDVDYAAAMVLEVMRESAGALGPNITWCGKTFDLSKAYKQLAVLPAHQRHAVVGFPVKGVWRFYKSISLPSGCTGSVYGFVRMSQAIWFIIGKLLHCITSHYFDDFPTLERSEGCRVLTLAFSATLDLLGWEHAKEGDKALDFSGVFDLLGVTFDLRNVSLGHFVISNKDSRVQKLCKMLEDIEAVGSITTAKASEMQGLLNFAVSFYMGRGLKHLISAFTQFAEGQRSAKSDELRALCGYAKKMLVSQKPRIHSLSAPHQPVLIFTDGAYENGTATAGAVVIDGQSRVAYEVVVPKELVDHWTQFAGDQIISQVELWALLVVRWCLRKQLHNRRVVEWIDNEAARMATIKANSPSATMRSLGRIMADIEICWPTASWTERVCSFSNPADLPSRGKIAEALHRYQLVEGKPLDASRELAEIVIQLLHSPYKDAPSELGAPTEHPSIDNSHP